MDKLGQKSNAWYDEEEDYLDELHAFLADFYQKIWSLEITLKGTELSFWWFCY